MASDSSIQDVENFAPLMQDFRDELVAWDGATQDYPLLPPGGGIQKGEEKKSASSADEESRTQSYRTIADERLHEQKCLFLRRTIPTVAEKWRKRRVSSSNSLESVFIMQCCWVPVTAMALESSSSGLSATGRLPPTSSGRRRPPSSVLLPSPAAIPSTDKAAATSTYLSHLLCGLSDGTLCLVNVLNFSKSYLIEGYGMREQNPREETKGHHHRSSSSSHRHDQGRDSEEGGSGAIVALDCAVPPLRSASLSEPTISGISTPSSTRSIRSATSKRLLALEIHSTPSSAASSTPTAGSHTSVVICVMRERDGVYVRQVADIFDRSNHKNLFPGMFKDASPCTALSTTSPSSNSNSCSSLPKRLLALPPSDSRIVYTSSTSTVIIDRPSGMDSAEGLSRRSTVVGLHSTPVRMENFRRSPTGIEKHLPSDKTPSSAFPFSISSSGRSYTVASFSECREFILVAVPPSGSATDTVLRPLRERYAIAILAYRPDLSSASPPRAGSSLSSPMNSSLHKSTATVPNSSGISTGSTNGTSSSHTRTPSDLQYDVEVPWCPLPFPKGSFHSSDVLASTASLPTTRTPTVADSRSSYPTPVLIRWWDSIAPSSRGDFVKDEKIHRWTPLVESERAGSSAISCPRILVVWSSGDVQLLQPWKTVVSASFLPELVVENGKTHESGIRGRVPTSSSSSEAYLCFSLRVVAQTRLLSRGVGNAPVEDKKVGTGEVVLQPGEKVVTAAKAWLPEEHHFRTVPLTKTAIGPPTATTAASASSSTRTPFPLSVSSPVSCCDGGRGLLAVVMGDNILEVLSLQFPSRRFLSPSSSFVSPPASSFSNDSSLKRRRDEDANLSSPSSISSVALTEGTEVAKIVATPLCQSYCSQDIPINDIHLVCCSSFSSPTLTSSTLSTASGSVPTLSSSFSHSSPTPLLSSPALSSSSALLVLTVVLRSGVVVLFDLSRMREVTTCVVGHLVERSRLLQVMKTVTLPSESGSSSDYRRTNSNTLSSGAGTALGGRAEGESSRAGGGRRNETQLLSLGSISSSGFSSSEVGDERFFWEWPPKMRAVVVSAGTGAAEKLGLNICLLDHDTVGVPERFL